MIAATAIGSTRASSEALLLVEVESGKVLHAENATFPWYPASVTKLMTLYATLRAVKERRITLDTLFTVSPNAVAQQPSKMGFKTGTTVTVDNAVKMLMVKSANDMAVVLAEGVSGSIENFADQMNRHAKRLGMTQTSYVNPNGLPADNQITSARDLAILARALIREFPEYDEYWHLPAIKLGKKVMRNYNTLIERYPGADGMKTGFICASGFNLVASATRNGKRLIAVVLGSPSSPVRAAKAAQLLESGFSSNALSWLTPSLGQVDALVPIAAEPPNLREEMCGKKRKRPAAEELDDEEAANGDGLSPHAFSLSNLRSLPAKPSTLVAPAGPVTPVVVFVGPAKKTPGTQVAAVPSQKPGPMPAATPAAAAPAGNPPAVAIGDPWAKPPLTFTPASQLAQTVPTGFNPPPAIDVTPVPLPRPRPRPLARPKAKPIKQ